jgi:hypothetical protein
MNETRSSEAAVHGQCAKRPKSQSEHNAMEFGLS